MKKNLLMRSALLLALTILLAVTPVGCGRRDETGSEDTQGSGLTADEVDSHEITAGNSAPVADSVAPNDGLDGTAADVGNDAGNDANNTAGPGDSPGGSVAGTELYVSFGDNGEPFPMRLYDNDTAAAIARHVGTADWRLPIYNYEGYDNWEVMQYYDIPSRYEIPSDPESVTAEEAGTVYYWLHNQ